MIVELPVLAALAAATLGATADGASPERHPVQAERVVVSAELMAFKRALRARAKADAPLYPSLPAPFLEASLTTGPEGAPVLHCGPGSALREPAPARRVIDEENGDAH